MLACGQQPFEANNADVVDTETMKKNWKHADTHTFLPCHTQNLTQNMGRFMNALDEWECDGYKHVIFVEWARESTNVRRFSHGCM